MPIEVSLNGVDYTDTGYLFAYTPSTPNPLVDYLTLPTPVIFFTTPATAFAGVTSSLTGGGGTTTVDSKHTHSITPLIRIRIHQPY